MHRFSSRRKPAAGLLLRQYGSRNGKALEASRIPEQGRCHLPPAGKPDVGNNEEPASLIFQAFVPLCGIRRDGSARRILPARQKSRKKMILLSPFIARPANF